VEPKPKPLPYLGKDARGLIVDNRDGKTVPVGYGDNEFSIQVIPRKAAVEMIRAHHYSHTIVNNSTLHLGLFIRGRWLGTLQFGYLKNPRTMGRIVAGTEVDEYLELNRMWLNDRAPRNSESRAISHAIRLIRVIRPKVKWIQSFADERCGRWGVVYQAANFLFCGSHLTRFYELDGQTYHEQQMSVRKAKYLGPGTRARYLQDNKDRATLRTCQQFRYIYFIDRRALEHLRFKVQPYPKPPGHDREVAIRRRERKASRKAS